MEMDNHISNNIKYLKGANASIPISQRIVELDNRYLIPIVVDNKIGFINKSLKIIIEPQFEKINGNFNTSQDIICASKNGKWGIINIDGVIVEFSFSYIIPGIGCNLFTVNKDYQHGVIDSNGNHTIEMGKYHWIDGYDNGLSRVKVKEKWGLVNCKGEVVLPLEYDEIWNFYGKKRTDTYIRKGESSRQLNFGSINFNSNFSEDLNANFGEDCDYSFETKARI